MFKPYKYHHKPTKADFWADYGADTPLWGVPPRGGNFGMVGLPVSEELKEDLRRWQRSFEAVKDGRDIEDYPVEFHSEGRRLLQRIRAELGPEWTITSSWYDSGGEVAEHPKVL